MSTVTDERRVPSPDGAHVASLTFAGQFGDGPAYHHLTIDDRPFSGRVFGREVVWIDDGSVVCLQEWNRRGDARYRIQPETSLVLIRPADWRECSYPQVQGFVRPIKALGATKIVCFDTTRRASFAIDVAAVDEWIPL